MGTLRHQLAVAHNWGFDVDVAKMREGVAAINDEWCSRNRPFIATPIITESGPHVNGSVTWLFAVDGSKEGWDSSDTVDALRDEFMRLCASTEYTDAAVLDFGGDSQIFGFTWSRSADRVGEETE